MEPSYDFTLPSEREPLNAFIYLVTGLHTYLETNRSRIPYSLRRALNVVALANPNAFPKTLHAFMRRCHQPLQDWYPLHVPALFDAAHPILAENRLSEAAQMFCIEVSEMLNIKAFSEHIPQTALDNLVMVDFRQKLKQHRDKAAAQQLYVQVRSQLIEHSYFTQRMYRALPLDVQREIRDFLDDQPELPFETLPVCSRCGLLERVGDDWQGVKPEYCSDHAENSPTIQWIANERYMLCLKRGVHLRTFLPGQAELTLFRFAEALHDQYPDQLQAVERYPGLDTYDVRLTFADTIWAVDVKDIAAPKNFIQQVQPLYREGELYYNHAYYVLPDARLNDDEYARQVQEKIDTLPRNLHIMSLSVFQQHMKDHIDQLLKPRKSRRKEG
jgi:hypothetical protein